MPQVGEGGPEDNGEKGGSSSLSEGFDLGAEEKNIATFYLVSVLTMAVRLPTGGLVCWVSSGQETALSFFPNSA